MFQSSPSGEAGCYLGRPSVRLQVCLFQSSPSGEAGCYKRQCKKSSARGLFQSSPSGEAGCYNSTPALECFTPERFNPHPAVKLGATSARAAFVMGEGSFNPHPAVKLGATNSLVLICQ